MTDEDTTISLVWRKSESFQEAIEGQMDVEVCGSVLTFDAYAFPKHSYLPLDAVGSLAKHIDENWNVTVINNTELDEIWKPDDEEVVVYTRLILCSQERSHRHMLVHGLQTTSRYM